MRGTTKWSGKLEHGGISPKEHADKFGEEGIQKILKERGIEWNYDLETVRD